MIERDPSFLHFWFLDESISGSEFTISGEETQCPQEDGVFLPYALAEKGDQDFRSINAEMCGYIGDNFRVFRSSMFCLT